MADSNSILSSERKEKEEVIDKALRPTRLKDYAGQDGIREQLDLFITAARNRGEIGVESIPGAYTEFAFTLELVKKETGLFTRGDKGENASKKGDGERPGKLTK